MSEQREVVYLIGSSAEKRKGMHGEGVAYADNDEVSAVFRVQGKDYYVFCRHPFASFTVWQYLAYGCYAKKSHLDKASAKELLRSVGLHLSLGKKIGKLSVVQRRLLTVATRMGEFSTIALNLDGVPCVRRERRALRLAVGKLRRSHAIWVAVTDRRFVPRGGIMTEVGSGLIYKRVEKTPLSKIVRRKPFLEKLQRKGVSPTLEKGKIVCVEHA